MKTVIRIMLAGLIVSASPFGIRCQNWQMIRPVTAYSAITSIYFTDSVTGFAVGTLGTILKTTTAARYWSQPDTVNLQTLYDVYFPDSQHGYACGDTGTILQTVDAGEHWTMQVSNSQQRITSIRFTDENHGLAVGSGGTVLKTTDGGSTWVSHSLAPDISLGNLSFTDDVTAYAIGTRDMSGSSVFKTEDGGATWNELPVDHSTMNFFYALAFPATDTGYIGGMYGAIYKTTDGGITWNKQNNTEHVSVHSFSFLDARTGYAVGGDALYFGNVIKTTDGGNTWTRTTTQAQNISDQLISVFFTSPETGYVSSGSTLICKTTDGGYTWHETTLHGIAYFSAIAFSDSVTGFVGSNYDKISRTVDGGTNWELISTGYENVSTQIKKICFTGNSTGYAIGDFGNFYKSADNGQSWQMKSNIYSSDAYLTSMSFPSADTGYVLGYIAHPYNVLSFVMKTVDGGTTWNQLPFNHTTVYYETCFVNARIGYLAGAGGKILRTSDGGTTWELLPGLVSQDLHALSFPAPDIGYAAGYGGVILKTTDGGQSWMLQTNLFGKNLRDLYFLDPHNGYAVGGKGTILATNDGGMNWEPEFSGTDADLTGVCFTSENRGYICGNECVTIGKRIACRGIILKTTNGGGLAVKPQESTGIGWISVFPNPSAGEIYLRWNSCERTTARIALLNLRGQTVKDFGQKELAAGSPVFLSFREPAAGFYILQVISGNKTFRTKLVISYQ